MEIHLLEDYFAHGIYTNERETLETNGEGQIDWDKTIGETFAFVRNSKPYYVDVRTSEFRDDSHDFFRLLHECVLTKCSRELQEIGVLDLFDIAPAELCARDFSDFGDIAYIKKRLDAEIKNQFVTRKQNLLKTLRAFLDEAESEKMGDSFCFYGTNAFNMV
ncbi:MAG: LlaJI family restriction endonuclease, partial [Treponemataceae bacterium]|nr:LlaJI family restriction endonuclease [Treponemataceae bacterium]